MITFNVEYLPDDKIAEATERFRQEYGLIEIPIQIEELVEFRLGMDIVPTPGLRTLVQTDGFISSDFTTIYVDEEICNCRTPYRLRFTLSHETGHFALHREYFSRVSYNNFDEYIAACTEIDDKDHNKMEYQGYTFGGLLLVPPTILKTEFINQLTEVEPLIKEAKQKGVGHTGYDKYVIDHIAAKLTQVFEVSTSVITRRINNDQLYALIP